MRADKYRFSLLFVGQQILPHLRNAFFVKTDKRLIEDVTENLADLALEHTSNEILDSALEQLLVTKPIITAASFGGGHLGVIRDGT